MKSRCLREAASSAAAPSGGAGTTYKVVVNSKLRAGFEPTSKDLGTLPAGQTITALETRVNSKGVTRVRFKRGWVSVTAGDGTVLLKDVAEEDTES